MISPSSTICLCFDRTDIGGIFGATFARQVETLDPAFAKTGIAHAVSIGHSSMPCD